MKVLRKANNCVLEVKVLWLQINIFEKGPQKEACFIAFLE